MVIRLRKLLKPDSTPVKLVLFLTVILIFIFVIGFRVFEWLKFESLARELLHLNNGGEQSFMIYVRGVEIFVILIAVVTFVYDFIFQKPRDRSLISARIVIELAELAKCDDIATVSPAIKNTMEILAKGDIPMRGLSIPTAVLSDARLTNANLANAQLTGVHLTNADLSGSELDRAILSNAQLSMAKLRSTKLNNAQLDGANLVRAILTNASLKNAVLTGAILTGAKLDGANLTNAVIANANLSNANLANAKGLTQDMLNVVEPTSPPISLPSGLNWPFEDRGPRGWER